LALDDAIRRQLAQLCQHKRTRRSGGAGTGLPCHWAPWDVRDPRTGEYFTEASAWEFVAETINSGHPIDPITLRIPRGRTGYVLLIGPPPPDKIYIKLQLGAGVVLGRSFHESHKPDDDQ
jgi:hypothetical protein